ncbi:uncharacterized protein F4812DRAFT_446553 [Daldinia caldariorum]|uniref:uncharacterized protein n=1 Tax=Daldinia caldariorum TaxID=326644 RepID=UPI002007A636|nr:uncharacterized protein F4812DRAFT_446553 [Daldinia caldariorum]KAI1463562.1 hypothetical protein F4812DRAFT_446553 [Daldinia caldariorum]
MDKVVVMGVEVVLELVLLILSSLLLPLLVFPLSSLRSFLLLFLLSSLVKVALVALVRVLAPMSSTLLLPLWLGLRLEPSLFLVLLNCLALFPCLRNSSLSLCLQLLVTQYPVFPLLTRLSAQVVAQVDKVDKVDNRLEVYLVSQLFLQAHLVSLLPQANPLPFILRLSLEASEILLSLLSQLQHLEDHQVVLVREDRTAQKVQRRSLLSSPHRLQEVPEVLARVLARVLDLDLDLDQAQAQAQALEVVRMAKEFHKQLLLQPLVNLLALPVVLDPKLAQALAVKESLLRPLFGLRLPSLVAVPEVQVAKASHRVSL